MEYTGRNTNQGLCVFSIPDHKRPFALQGGKWSADHRFYRTDFRPSLVGGCEISNELFGYPLWDVPNLNSHKRRLIEASVNDPPTNPQSEEAALEWFRGTGLRARARAASSRPVNMPEAPSPPALSQRGERREDGELVLAARLRGAIPAVETGHSPKSSTLATLRGPDRSGLPKLLSGELSVAESNQDK